MAKQLSGMMYSSESKLNKYLYQNKGLILTLLIAFLFKDFFLPYYQEYIVDTVLDKFSQSLLTDALFVLAFPFLLYFVYQKIRIRYFLKVDYAIHSLLFILIYSFVRYNFQDQFLGFYSNERIKYFDLLYVVGILPVVLKLAFWITQKNKKKDEPEFFPDDPITSPDEDILNRKQNALQVSRLIKGYRSRASIAIGVVGAWGDGKTSFMNIVENQIKDDDSYIIVHFNSWLNISVHSIIADFFTTIEKSVSRHSIDISKEVKKYANNLLSIHKNSATEALLNVVKIIPDNSLSDDFDNLNRLLNELDKKIVVFFDDLDRLQPNEVFEVLKLIRNTASFDLFSYVVGYDKAYLIEALRNNNIPYPEKYCEKIFIKEFPLPSIMQEEINGFLKSSILKTLPNKEIELEQIFENPAVLLYVEQSSVFSSLNNLRNAKRFLNEFLVSIRGLEDDVDIADFILVKLLKFSYYDVYRLLFNKNVYLTNNDKAFSGKRRYINYVLRGKEEKTSFSVYGEAFHNSLLKEHLISLKIYSDAELEIISSICTKLFGKSNYGNSISNLSISYGHNYFKYFNDEIAESAFKNAEFKVFMEGDYDKRKEIIDRAYGDDRLVGLLLFIYKINVYQDISLKAEYENLLRSLFYIAHLKSKMKYLKYTGIDFDVLDEFMSNYKNLIVEKFQYRSIEELKKFYKSIFYQDQEFYDFETDYVKHLYDRSGTSPNMNFPFNRKEMEDYLSFCFDNDSKLIKGIDDKFWHCYRLCIIKDWNKDNDRSWSSTQKVIEKNKNKLLYDIIPLYLDAFLVNCVYPQSFYGQDEYSNKVGLHDDGPIRLFGSYGNFISYLEELELSERSDFLEEFLSFVKEVDDAKDFINFDFTYPPVLEKLESAKRRERPTVL